MITNPYAFSDEEQEKIDDIKQSSTFSSKSWGDNTLSAVRASIKQHYLSEQNNTCPYCQQQLKTKNGNCWHIEHIIPRATVKSFMFEPFNLCVSCIDCNIAKSEKKVTNSSATVNYPSKSENYFMIHPHFDEYEDHINIIEAGFYYVAKNPKGEETIKICHLNRFYAYGGFSDDPDCDQTILLLSNLLKDTTSSTIRNKILKEIAAKALKNCS